MDFMIKFVNILTLTTWGRIDCMRATVAIKNSWQKLWVMHEEAKALMQFMVSGNHTSAYTKENGEQEGKPGPSMQPRQKSGLILGPMLFLLALLFVDAEGLSREAVAILASTLWIATWWITEAIPIPATSLLPLVLFPVTGGLESGMTASSYGDDTIFLFMGAF